VLTTTQAAAELGVSTAWMRALIKAGRVPSKPNPLGAGRVVELQDLCAVRNLKRGRPWPKKEAVAS